MSFIPKPHEIYKHFKGNLYQITTVAEHTETGEQLVVYQALYGDFKTYARPLAMFTDRVDKRKYPDAEQEFRFELQGPEAARQKKESGPSVSGEDARMGQMPDAEGKSEVSGLSGGLGADTSQRSDMPKEEQGADGFEEELSIDPLVLEFLDSDSYEQRLNILAGLHHRITNDMITTMAIACDIEIEEGEVEERYEALKTCLLTLQRYECNRLR